MTRILKAVCLNSLDYRDNDRLLILLSAENGKTVARIRSVKSPKSKLKAAAAPYCYAEYSLSEKGGYSTVTGAEVIEQFFGAWTDAHKNLASGVVAEVLEKFTAENVPAENEFALGLRALFAVNYAEGTPYVHTLKFLLEFMTLIGVDIADAELSRRTAALFAAAAGADDGELDCLEYEVGEVVGGILEAGRIISAVTGESFRTFPALNAFIR